MKFTKTIKYIRKITEKGKIKRYRHLDKYGKKQFNKLINKLKIKFSFLYSNILSTLHIKTSSFFVLKFIHFKSKEKNRHLIS